MARLLEKSLQRSHLSRTEAMWYRNIITRGTRLDLDQIRCGDFGMTPTASRWGPGVWHLPGAQQENIQREIRPSLTPDTRRSTIPLRKKDLVNIRCRARERGGERDRFAVPRLDLRVVATSGLGRSPLTGDTALPADIRVWGCGGELDVLF